MDNQMLIVTQVVLKGFMESEKRLPENKEDWERIQEVVFKTWLVSKKAEKKISELN